MISLRFNMINDFIYKGRLAKAVGCRRRDLAAVMGPNELIKVLKRVTPDNFNPANADNGLFNIDMHLHTKASDGSFEPKTLFNEVDKQVLKSLKAGIKTKFSVAITDHDTVDGVIAALSHIAEETRKNPKRFKYIRFIPGIEFNSKYNNPAFLKQPALVETLVYGINPYDKNLYNFVQKNKQKNNALMDTIVADAHKKFGVDVSDFADYRKENWILAIPGSPALNKNLKIRYLAKKKGLSDEQIEALCKGKLFKRGININTPDIKEVIKVAKGAVASISHPLRIDWSESSLPEEKAFLRLFKDFKKWGGKAVEANYHSYGEKNADNAKILFIHKLCERVGLLKSGGVDNHKLSLYSKL